MSWKLKSLRPRVRQALAASLAGVLALGLAGCGSAGAQSEDADTVTVAYQPGLGYAPLLIAKEQRLLEKELPGKRIVWKELSSGAAVRDGMVADEIQIGSGGVGPFLVGWSSGVDWKLVGAMDNMNLRLMAKKPQYRSLKDLAGRGKIAVPAPDSIQAVVLRRAAEEDLGKASTFDQQIAAMDHPAGMQALISGQIDAHLTSPPFQNLEEQDGARVLAKSYDYFGEHTTNSTFVRQSYASENPDVVSALRKVQQDTVHLLANDPERAAELLAKESGGEYTKEQMLTEVTSPDVEYTTRPQGFMKFARFMKDVGLIEKTPGKAGELFYPNELTRGGS